MELKPVLTIGGSDCSGGAGIQGDIKTLTANGVFAMSVVTTLTAQNTTGHRAYMDVSPDFLANQIDMIFEDVPPAAIKIGAVPTHDLILTLVERLQSFGAKNIVTDLAMVANDGTKLIEADTAQLYAEKIFPMSTVVTLGLKELEFFSGLKVSNREEISDAAKAVSEKYSCAVLAKGSNDESDASDFLYESTAPRWFRGKKIDTKNTHGAGAALSSAIAAGIAKGSTLVESIDAAKRYLTGALSSGLALGKGVGSIDHGWNLR
jgi:hydroxymethylpyrimidine/phosphomethylpyrimidine kinase